MNRLSVILLRSLSYQKALAIAQNELNTKCPRWLGPQIVTQSIRQQRTSAAKVASDGSGPVAKDEDQPKKKKTKEVPKITLIGQNQGMSITTLEEAQKLAKRRDLRLMLAQTMDTKTQRPVYKLVTQAEMLAEQMKELGGDEDKSEAQKSKSSQLKSEKSLTIGSRISEHDLNSRIKNIGKWLNKRHEVRILIEGRSQSDLPNCEKIAKAIEQSVKDTEPALGRVVQKRTKGTNIKFSILPLANKEATDRSPA